VIDKVVWIDSWPSIAGACYNLICVSAGEEQAQMVYACVASRCGETSRLGSRDPVTDGMKCKPHGGKKSKIKSCTIPWLSLKDKTEPRRPWRPSHEWDWHGGRTTSAGFAVVHHKNTGFLG
jgi:hypothetical protein